MVNEEDSLYFHNNPNRMQYISDEAILLGGLVPIFFIYQNTVSGTEITDYFDVINFFHIQKIKFPVLTCYAYIIHSITPLHTENEIDL